MGKEFTGKMVILAGVSSSWTMNPQEGWLFPGNYQPKEKESTGGMRFFRELHAHRREIHTWNGIPPGITSSRRLIKTGKIKMPE
jgi:hypothetical protein